MLQAFGATKRSRRHRVVEALSPQEAAWGGHNPLIAETLYHLAHLYLEQERLEDALPLLWRIFTLFEQRLRQEALAFSSSQLARFLQGFQTHEACLHALLRTYPEDTRVQRLALAAVLLFKGRALGEAASTSLAIHQGLSTRDCAVFEQLRELRTQLSALANPQRGWQSPEHYQQYLRSLAARGDALEAELARRSAPLRARTTPPPAERIVDQVAAALPRDGALVELVVCPDSFPSLWPRSGTRAPQSPARLRYLAIVLFPDARIRAVDLGWAELIDKAASELRNALANRDAAYLARAQQLYALAFQPLHALVGKARRLFLSTDGQLSFVPFAALHDGNQFLIDSFDFIYLTSGKELLPRVEQVPVSHSVVVLADPDFSSSWRMAICPVGEPPAASSPDNVAQHPCVPLPGTRQEAEAIQRMMPQARLFLGSEATKERLLSLSAPGVLHLATHGSFEADAPLGLERQRAMVHFGALGTNASAPRPADPLLRAALALSPCPPPSPPGAHGPQPPADNGWVTALEVEGMNLWGTQLVVLSACDTGRGEVKLGQGVYGLRRAFVTAGAETVVTSLWKVNDETTRALMEAYYRFLLDGQGRCGALQAAMRLMRQSHPHPHSWAPFIAQGSDAPLEVSM